MSNRTPDDPVTPRCRGSEREGTLSRREFVDRLARIGLVAGTAGISGTPLFAQQPRPPSNVRIGGGSGNFVPEPGFSAAGSLADGGTITISRQGGGFGTKPNGHAPAFWMPCKSDLLNHGRLGATGMPPFARGSLNSNNCPAGSAVTWEVDYGKCNSYSGPPYYTDTPCGEYHSRWTSGYYLNFGTPPAHMYLAVKRNYAFNYAALEATWEANHGSDPPHVLGIKDLRCANAVESGYTIHAVNNYNGRTAYWWNNSFMGTQDESEIVRQNQWLTTELIFKANTPGVADGLYKLIEQARLVHDPLPNPKTGNAGCMPNHQTVPTGAGGLQLWSLDHLNSYNRPDLLSGMYIYVDYLYMDDSWCHALISDETSYQDISTANPTGADPRGQNWAAARDYLREPQIIQTWSDTAVSFTCRQGAHASLSGKCLYVMNDAGTVVKAGTFA